MITPTGTFRGSLDSNMHNLSATLLSATRDSGSGQKSISAGESMVTNSQHERELIKRVSKHVGEKGGISQKELQEIISSVPR